MNNNNSNSENNSLKEVEDKLVLTPEDVQGAAEFWTQFEIPMPEELKKSIENFIKSPSIETQNEFKLQLTKTIGFSEHDAFKDELFQEIVEECRNVTYEMTFNKDLEKTLLDQK
jgi:hypothetical protein